MGAAVDHGPDQLFLFDVAVHHIAQALFLLSQGLLDGGLQLFQGVDPGAFEAVGVGQLHEVRAPLGDGLAVAAVVDELLPLADHAQTLLKIKVMMGAL